MALRVDEIGFGGVDVGSRLGDFFWPAAVAQAGHHLTLGGNLRRRLRQLRLQSTDVQACQNLPLAHVIPFLDQHLGNSIAVVKRQLYLAEIDITVKN